MVSLDHEQKFGLPKPLDLVEELTRKLAGKHLKKIEVIKDTNGRQYKEEVIKILDKVNQGSRAKNNIQKLFLNYINKRVEPAKQSVARF